MQSGNPRHMCWYLTLTFPYLRRKLLVLLGAAGLLVVACGEDAVPAQLPGWVCVCDGGQPLHALLHLCHAHILVCN